MAGPILIVLVGLLLAGAAPLFVENPISGQVIDRDSGGPIPGAAVQVSRAAHCPRLLRGQTTHRFPPRETKTDGAGRFEFDRTVLAAPCLAPIWSGDLKILVPGFRPEHLHDSGVGFPFDRPIRSGLFELERWRYRLEIEEFRELWKESRESEETGGKWGEAIALARQFPFRRAGTSGVLVSHPGARFSRVAVTHVGKSTHDYRVPIVLAQDVATQTILAWTAHGRPVRLPWSQVPGLSLLEADRSTNPVLTDGSRIFFSRSPDSIQHEFIEAWWTVRTAPVAAVRAFYHPGLSTFDPSSGLFTVYPPGGRLPGGRVTPPAPPVVHRLVELLPSALPPVECFATVQADFDLIVVIAGGPTGRTSFAVPTFGLHQLPWKAEQITLPAEVARTPIVTCAGGSRALYLALEGRGIQKLRLHEVPERGSVVRNWTPETLITLEGSDGPREFRALAVGKLKVREVVYAVAQGNSIYRFADDGRPDERVEPLMPSISE